MTPNQHAKDMLADYKARREQYRLHETDDPMIQAIEQANWIKDLEDSIRYHEHRTLENPS